MVVTGVALEFWVIPRRIAFLARPCTTCVSKQQRTYRVGQRALFFLHFAPLPKYWPSFNFSGIPKIMDSTRPIRALIRGLEALAVLNRRNGATVSEVTNEIKLPRTTTYRILETLKEAGYVYRDAADDRHRLTLLVRGLADGFDDEAWITQIARPCINDLCKDIVWPVNLLSPSGTSMLIRETTDHDSPLAVERFSAGFRVPLLLSASGRVYLAFCRPEQRDTLLDILSRSPREEDKPARS